MRDHAARLLLSACLVVFAAGCAGDGVGGPGASDPAGADAAFQARAEAVAAAWHKAGVDEAWRTGLVPLEDLTVLPEDPAFTEATKQAFLAGWYVMRAPMPREVPGRQGTVRFVDGGTLPVPLLTLAEAYAELDLGDPPPCTDATVPPQPEPPATGTDPEAPVSDTAEPACAPLTVTAVTLGTVDLRTSRGEARVPAWLFTVRELKSQVARVAVAASAVRPVPSVPADGLPAVDGLVGAQDLTAVDDARLSYRLGVGACDKQIKPLAYETDDVVVIAGTVTRDDGPCTDQLLYHPVRVTLDAPVADRPVLDGATGAVLMLARE
jgi:hypothetical protein